MCDRGHAWVMAVEAATAPVMRGISDMTGKRLWGWVWKGALIVIGLLVALVVAFIGIVNSQSTDCFAFFPTERGAERTLLLAHALGLDDTELNRRRGGGAAIRISSGETGDDAREFRRTFRFLVLRGGGHMGKGPCVERPFFN